MMFIDLVFGVLFIGIPTIITIILLMLNINKYKNVYVFNDNDVVSTSKKENKSKEEIKDGKCQECGHKLNDGTLCSYCGYDNKKVDIKNKKYKKGAFVGVATVVAAVIILFGILIGANISENKKQADIDAKILEGVELYKDYKLDESEKVFNEVKDESMAKHYLNGIKVVRLLDEGKYDDAYKIYETISEGSEAKTYSVESYVNLTKYVKNNQYKEFFEDQKYNSAFVTEKHKELYNEAMYTYGVNAKNEGKYTTSKEAFDKIPGYKDVDELLKDKYYKLIGNSYSYSTSAGYKWGLMSFLFYSTGDTVNYNVFTQSLFDTNIPTGYEYSYVIKDNVLILGGSLKFNILSFDGNTLVIKQNNNKFTLTKQ